jgi:hypothetical protein
MSRFLKLIREEMLVVDQKKRYEGSMVIQGLHDILRECDKDAAYACSSKHNPNVEGKKAVEDRHHHEANAIARQAEELAGISGGISERQENPGTGLEFPSQSINGLDLTGTSGSYRVDLPRNTTHKLSSPLSTTRLRDVSPGRHPLRTPQTLNAGGSQSPHQQPRPIKKLIQHFESLSRNGFQSFSYQELTEDK